MIDLLLTELLAGDFNVVVLHESLPDREELELPDHTRRCQLDFCELEQRHEVQDVEPETLLDCLNLLFVLRVQVENISAVLHLADFVLDFHQLLQPALLDFFFHVSVVHLAELDETVLEELNHLLEQLAGVFFTLVVVGELLLVLRLGFALLDIRLPLPKVRLIPEIGVAAYGPVDIAVERA